MELCDENAYHSQKTIKSARDRSQWDLGGGRCGCVNCLGENLMFFCRNVCCHIVEGNRLLEL